MLSVLKPLCNPKTEKTVLIVDDDLGFAFWLGQALDRAGFQTWPARSVASAESLLQEMKLRVDLLLITASLPQAHDFATRLEGVYSDLKVIAVYDEIDRVVEQFARDGAVRQKPQAIDSASESDWVKLVADILEKRLRLQ